MNVESPELTSVIELTKQQMAFITTDKKYSLFCGGLGSGKSFALCCWIIIQSQKPGLGLICNNTYRQLNDSTLSTLFNLLESLNIPYTYSSQKGYLTINGNLIHTRSMDHYDSLRGSEYAWCAADECAFYKKAAWQVMLGRIRDKRGSLQIKGASTPNGFNFLYEDFVLKATKNHFMQNASSYDNPYLSREYIESLEGQYDEKLLEQELHGKMINLTSGQVYYAFDRNVHLIDSFTPGSTHKLLIGCDFNVNPITAVLVAYDGRVLTVYDEVYINNSNTYELVETMVRKWNCRHIAPDSTGSSRRTAAHKTDHQILKDGGFTLEYSYNPPVKDRYNCINGLLRHKKLQVTNNCKMLLKDLEQFAYNNNDPSLSHISDALGYAAWKLAPLRTERPTSANISLHKDYNSKSSQSSFLNENNNLRRK